LHEFIDFTMAYYQAVRSDPGIVLALARQNLIYAILIGIVWSDLCAIFICLFVRTGTYAVRYVYTTRSRIAKMVSRWIINARSRKISYLIYFLVMMIPVIPYIRASALASAQIIGLKSVLLSALFLNPARMMLLYLIILPLL